MAKKIITANDVNVGLNRFIDDLLKIGASSKGDEFDKTVLTTLKKNLSGSTLISTDRWCSRKKTSPFIEYNKKTLKNNYNFSDLKPLIDNGESLDLVIVDKPNGSQKWPDLLVVFQGIGLPIEVKSSKTDLILWNSGTPKSDSIYIFNNYGKARTTCFLGQHAITDSELLYLINKSISAENLNEKIPNSNRWSYYVRDMFNSNQSFFNNDEDRMKSEMDLKEFILELSWNDSQKSIF